MECRRSLFHGVTLLGLLLSLVLCGSCLGPARDLHGPVVIITLGGLRADVVGPDGLEPDWTPRLGELGLPWRGTAVLASSEPRIALTSLWSGARPWQHQRLSPSDPSRLPTLAKALSTAGYRSRAFVPLTFQSSLKDGFVQVQGALSPQRTAAVLSGLANGEMLWIHLSEAEVFREVKRRGRGRQFERQRLLAFADPAIQLPESERRDLWRVYGKGVRRLDTRVGEIVDLLRGGPDWERTTLLIIGSHGVEFGEHDQILYGENLGRETLEVPLFVHLPAAVGQLAEPTGSRVAQTRLWATVAEIVGVRPAPLHPPSLFQRSNAPIISELYASNGVNHFSLLSSRTQSSRTQSSRTQSSRTQSSRALQLHWSARFGAAEPEYYLASRVQAGARARILSEPVRRIFGRLDAAFRQSPALSGTPTLEPIFTLERWTDQGITEAVEDPVLEREMAHQLRRQWLRFTDRERTPNEERGTGKGPKSNRLTPAQSAG